MAYLHDLGHTCRKFTVRLLTPAYRIFDGASFAHYIVDTLIVGKFPSNMSILTWMKFRLL